MIQHLLKIRRKSIQAFLKKEFSQMLRDPRMRVVLFVAPLLMIILFGYAVSTDVKNVSMAIMDEDRSQNSRALIEHFTGSGYFVVYTTVDSEKEVEKLLDAGKAEMFLHIRENFSKDIKSDKTAPLQLIVDGSDSSRASIITAYINQITAGFSSSFFNSRMSKLIINKDIRYFRMKKPIELKERALFNPDLSSRNFFLPGILSILISMVTITLTSMSIVKEREIGTIDQITVSPLTPAEIIAGKIIPFVIVSFIDILFISIVAILWFRVPFNGSYFFLLFCSLIYIFSTTAIGLYISTISRTQQQALLSTFLYMLPAMLFSGFVFPIYAMPEIIQWLTLINPMRYFTEIVRGIFLKGVGLDILWPQLLALTILALSIFYLSVRRFARRLD